MSHDTGMFDYTKINPQDCEFVEVASVDEISKDGRLFLEIDQTEIVLFAIGEEYFAIDDICSHDDGPLGDGELDGFHVVCPRHGARFDVRTGKSVTLPAVVDISAYPVRISDGVINVGIPEKS